MRNWDIVMVNWWPRGAVSLGTLSPRWVGIDKWISGGVG